MFLGGHFAPATTGHFESATGGHFAPAMGGQFTLKVGGHFHRFFHSKALAKVLGYEHDADNKGKIDYGHANIAPAGGDGGFILWHPNSEYGVYVSIPYHPEYNQGYENYKIQGIGWGSDPIQERWIRQLRLK